MPDPAILPYTYAVWYTVSIDLKIVCEWVYIVSLFMIFTLTLVLLIGQVVSGSIPSSLFSVT